MAFSSVYGVLVLAAVASASKPVFDGTFGANCPPCKEFGKTVLKKLYAADGIAASVEFSMHSAVRSAGSPSKDHSWDCPDEDAGCPMTKWFLCAVDGWNTTTTTQDQRVNFLTCWDDSTGTNEARVKQCAKQVGFDMAAITACNSGSKGEALQLAAAQYFEKRFPTHAHGGMFMVPHIFINGKDQSTGLMNYNTILKALCKTGIKAAACNDLSNSLSSAHTTALEVKFIGGSLVAPLTKCHFDDPASGQCQADETNITVTGTPGSFCSPKCSADGDCPTDVCPGTVGTPSCVLQDSQGNKFCVLTCKPGGTGVLCSSNDHMTCKKVQNQNTGVCTYNS